MDDQLLSEVKCLARNESLWQILAVFSLVIVAFITFGLAAREWQSEVRLRSIEAQLKDYQADKWKVTTAHENAKSAVVRSSNNDLLARSIMIRLEKLEAKGVK